MMNYFVEEYLGGLFIIFGCMVALGCIALIGGQAVTETLSWASATTLFIISPLGAYHLGRHLRL